MPNSVLLHTSPDHRPRLEFGASSTLRLESLHPEFVGGDLFLDVVLRDVWGEYDLANVTATISGPGLEATNMTPATPPPSHLHCYSCDWGQFRFQAPAAGSAGTYHFEVKATTLAGAIQTFPLDTTFGGKPAMPGPPASFLVLGLLAAAFLFARRRSS